jgi:hypothetical protein
VDVVARRKQAVEVARAERSPAQRLESARCGPVELLVLVAAVMPTSPQARWSWTVVIAPGGTTRLNSDNERSGARKTSH